MRTMETQTVKLEVNSGHLASVLGTLITNIKESAVRSPDNDMSKAYRSELFHVAEQLAKQTSKEWVSCVAGYKSYV